MIDEMFKNLPYFIYKKTKLQARKVEYVNLDFCMNKKWQILKHFINHKHVIFEEYEPPCLFSTYCNFTFLHNSSQNKPLISNFVHQSEV